MEKIRRALWLLVELGFLVLLLIVLVYLLLGPYAGGYVTGVVGNITKFAGEAGTQSLIGIGVILAIIYLVMRRIR